MACSNCKPIVLAKITLRSPPETRVHSCRCVPYRFARGAHATVHNRTSPAGCTSKLAVHLVLMRADDGPRKSSSIWVVFSERDVTYSAWTLRASANI
eukprot:70674-Pleurochrysis_carterae.AAC.1